MPPDLLGSGWLAFFGAFGALIQARAEAPNRGPCHHSAAYAARGSTEAGVLGVSVSWQLVSKPPAAVDEHEPQ